MSVYWMHAGTSERLRNDCRKIAEQLGIPGCSDLSLDTLSLIQNWFESQNSRRWLIVYDNADDINLLYSKEGEHLAQYFPCSDHGSILMTTRNRQVGIKFATAKNVVNLEALSDAESCALIATKLGDEDETKYTERLQLARTLGGIPLALTQATCFIQENEMTTIGHYLEIYDSSDEEKVHLLSQDFEDDTRDPDSANPIARTWAVTFDFLKQNHRLAAVTLCQMSMLHCQAIPESFIISAIRLTSSSHASVEETLGVLRAYSLISLRCPAKLHSKRSFDLHRLVQLVTRNWLSMSNTPYWTYDYFLAKAINILDHEYTVLMDTLSCEQVLITKPKYLPHALELISHPKLLLQCDEVVVPAIFEGQKLKDEEHVHADPHMICAYCTVSLLSDMYSQQCTNEQALRMVQKGTAILNHTLGPEHPSTLSNRSHEASLLVCLNRYNDAERIERDILAKRRLTCGPTDDEIVSSLISLARVLVRQGQKEEAERLLRQILDSGKEQYEGSCRWRNPIFDAMVALSNVLSRQGRTEEASTYLSKSLGLVSQKRQLLDIAEVYASQGDYNEAEKLCLRFLADEDPLENYMIATPDAAWRIMGEIYKMQKLYEEARMYFTKGLEYRKAVYGDDHFWTRNALSYIEYLYIDDGTSLDT